MKKKIKHLFFVLFVIASLFVILPIESNAATSGTCGDNLTWTLDDSGTLTISGTGDMEKGDSSYFSWLSLDSSIKSVVINDGITKIGDEAFRGCTGLTSITIPNSVTSIGRYAFYDCTGLASITIPNTVTSIGSYAFYGTAFYNDSANWDNGVLYIDNVLIKMNTGDRYSIKPGTRFIADYAFSGCTGLTSVTIPDSVISIGDSAFGGCYRLTSITIPDSVTNIGDSAFSYCEWLTSITIPDSVTSIGYATFDGCSKLTTVYYTGTKADWNNINIGSSNTYLTKAQRIYLECTKTTVSANGKSFTVTPKNIENDNTVILALYSGNVFLGLQSEVYKGKDIPFTTSEDYTKAKVMVWNGFDKMTPISEVENVK